MSGKIKIKEEKKDKTKRRQKSYKEDEDRHREVNGDKMMIMVLQGYYIDKLLTHMCL